MISSRRKRSAMAVFGACVVLPASTWGAWSVVRHLNEQNETNGLVERVQKICMQVAPGAHASKFVVASLMNHRPGSPSREVWSVQALDERGEFVGETVWDAGRDELLAASWHVDPVASASTSLSVREATEIARMRLAQMDILDAGADWRIKGKPSKVGHCWTVWCESPKASYRIKLEDPSGRLLSAEWRHKA